ncbi:replication initiation protein [Hymenobacter crusticola]|uniref:replication initiation protein n=1 Tax=Hymenobacter crusticola TaxID=1770526 RepID=UPI0015C50C96|nr:replication initiation protein [Hymenobacter crusticola]
MKLVFLLSIVHLRHENSAIMQGNLFSEAQNPSKLLVQRNDLVNARFGFTTLEMRLFMAMLSRIRREDTEFHEVFIPVREIIALSGRRPSRNDYDQLERMCDKITSKKLTIRTSAPPRRRKRRVGEEDMGDFEKIPLMAYASYSSEHCALKVRFNDYVRDHLLQLNEGNFTQVELIQLLKLKSSHSFRIYWLLKQRGEYGERTFGVDELKCLLGLEEDYPKFSMFRIRVLKVAQRELAQTNLAFEFEEKNLTGMTGVQEIRFVFTKLKGKNSLPEPGGAETPKWMEALRAIEVSEASILAVGQRIELGHFDPDYVLFVIAELKKRKEAGKITTLAGYVVDAIKNDYKLPEYLVRLQKRQSVGQPKEKKAEPVIYLMTDVRAGYDLAVKRKQTIESFEEYLQRIYLAQGFQIEKNRLGIEAVVKRTS